MKNYHGNLIFGHMIYWVVTSCNQLDIKMMGWLPPTLSSLSPNHLSLRAESGSALNVKHLEFSDKYYMYNSLYNHTLCPEMKRSDVKVK